MSARKLGVLENVYKRGETQEGIEQEICKQYSQEFHPAAQDGDRPALHHETFLGITSLLGRHQRCRYADIGCL